jgi:hypothetical protein
MKIRYMLVGGLVTLGLFPAFPAQAAPVQFDISSVFNSDSVVNAPSGTIDTTQSAVDGGSYSLATQGALDAGCTSPWDPPVKGLPNNGQFAGNGDHPDVTLAYRNSNNGNNARRSEPDDQFSFSVPHNKYRKIHFFGISGDGPSSVKLTLKYTDDSTQVKEFVIGDWFEAPVAGTYTLIEQMDRMNPAGTECDESPHEFSTAHIFGKRMKPNKSKTLKKITIKKVGGSGTVLTTLGVTGVKA